MAAPPQSGRVGGAEEGEGWEALTVTHRFFAPTLLTHFFDTYIQILLLETSCPLVGWSPFLPHLTQTHTNLMCERFWGKFWIFRRRQMDFQISITTM